jgi:nucleoid-associated protein YgaU
MGSGRYNNRVIRTNTSELYEDLREKRGVKQIEQFLTQRVHKLSPSERRNIVTVRHIWGLGDRYWKLAARYYKNPEYWWVIAWFNQKPTESHIAVGQVIYIPSPPELLATMYSRPGTI